MLTKVLFKIFVKGFYRMHAGLILTMFIGLFIHFFFTSVLNQTHLTQEGIILNNLKLVLTSVSNPAAMGLLFMIWLVYTIKSAKYVGNQLFASANQFLFYSSNSMQLRRQWFSWFITQFLISLPIVISGLFASVVGVVFGYYLIPALIPFFLLLIIASTATYYCGLSNKLFEDNDRNYNLGSIKNWQKPLFSLFLWQILLTGKLTYLITKLGSAMAVIAFYVLFYNEDSDLRAAGMAMLFVVLTHAVLVFQSQEFDSNFLKLARNFPISKRGLFLNISMLYFLMLLPEILWIFSIYDFSEAVQLTFLAISFTLLCRAVLYRTGLNMTIYLQYAFACFIISSLVVLFGLILPLAILNLILSYLIFYTNHDRFMED